MLRIDVLGLFGVGLLIAGLVFLATDPILFDHWYDWILGPFFLMMGCALAITWALGRMHHLLQPQGKDEVAVNPTVGNLS